MLQDQETTTWSPEVLRTKLYIPLVRQTRIPRAHLMARLSEGLSRPLVLISAPPGFGKTAVLSEWIAQHRNSVRVAWISLDEGDNDLTRFLYYLVASLEGVKPGITDEAKIMLQSPLSPADDGITTLLINRLDEVPEDFVLVLDDYQFITNPIIHHALNFFLEHRPPRMHLWIASRADPPWPLITRLRAHDELVELRVSDLRLTREEASLFLTRVMGLYLSAEDISALQDRTEGWVVGLQLAALSLRRQRDPSAFIAAFTGSHPAILDYLTEHALDAQDEPVKDFLLKISSLDRMNASLCDAVTEQQNSEVLLQQLERQNVFLVALDEDHRWYRFHRLFSDVLRHRLQSNLGNKIRELYFRASEWCEQHELMDEAIQYALAAKDSERAAELIDRNAEGMIERTELATLLRWLNTLPNDLLQTHPRLAVACAIGMLNTGNLVAVQPLLEQAERAVADHGFFGEKSSHGPAVDGTRRWLNNIEGAALAIRGTIAWIRLDSDQAIKLSKQALSHIPVDAVFLRSFATFNVGNAYWQAGELQLALDSLNDLMKINQGVASFHFNLFTRYYVGCLQTEQGRLREAFATHQYALDLVTQYRQPLIPAACFSVIGLAEVLREWNDLESALRYVEQGIGLGKVAANIVALTHAYEILALIKQEQGEARAALEVMDSLEELWSRRTFQEHGYGEVLAFRARLAILQGELDTASRWAEKTGMRIKDEISYSREDDYFTFVRLLIAREENLAALHLLERLVAHAESGGRMRRTLEGLVLTALVHGRSGKWNLAKPNLQRALALAEPQGYVRLFVDEGNWMGMLLTQLIAENPKEKVYAEMLLAAFERSSQVDRTSKPLLVEPLSEREMQVLDHLAGGLSNREIGERLSIETSTVKTHLNNLYSKLGINSRLQALARARELGLLRK